MIVVAIVLELSDAINHIAAYFESGLKTLHFVNPLQLLKSQHHVNFECNFTIKPKID